MNAGATFPTVAAGLPSTAPPEVVELSHGASYELRVAAVEHEVADSTMRMLAYNGSIPGPTLRVRQGSEIDVVVVNGGDHETTVHWHGLRLENRNDGVPGDTQDPIPVGGSFTYRLRFPDDGLYWYHPHVREDYGLEMGLYGNILVDASDGSWPPVDVEAIITLDDILVEDGHVGTFRVDDLSHTAMGRFGNVMLTRGATDLQVRARVGDVVRCFLTNTANTRIFNVAVPGARAKLVAGDSGRYEHEEWVDSVLLSPSERAVVDVLFPTAGSFAIEHRTPDRTYQLGTVTVDGSGRGSPHRTAFESLGSNETLVAERARLADELRRAPDKTLTFIAEMPLLHELADADATAWACPMHPDVVADEPGTCPICGMQLLPATATGHVGPSMATEHGHHGHGGDGLEWEDLMPDVNARADATNMIWKVVDAGSGAANDDIDWAFVVGDRVKLRLVNTMDSDHPMHHPFHVHGAGRFLVVARDDVAERNLVWKDTVLVRSGETVDLLLEVTNPGLWMAHCHIAEHNQNGMMLSFRVDP